MTDFIPPTVDSFGFTELAAEPVDARPRNIGQPSNDVYARVGDAVLRAAREGVRGGMRPEDIIREIVTEHHIRLSLGEFRLLLASRRINERTSRQEPAGEAVLS
jgi:hypothetical protein